MRSMTGFGRGIVRSKELEVIVEIQTVNKKGLETSISYPREWPELEGILQELIRERLYRGKIQGQVRVAKNESPEKNIQGISISETSWENLKQIAEQCHVPFKPDLQVLISWIQLIQGEAQPPVLDEIKGEVVSAIHEALNGVLEMREREGRNLLNDFTLRLKLLEEVRTRIAEYAPEGAVRFREHLMSRLQSIGIEVNVEDERFIKEVALFAERSDITEELIRIESHLQQMKSTLLEKDPIGRKLEFLLQEIHREFNTIGSKSTLPSISQEVIQAKQEIDRLREQSLNVE